LLAIDDFLSPHLRVSLGKKIDDTQIFGQVRVLLIKRMKAMLS